MLKIYGSMLCKDCVACVEAMEQAGVDFVFCDFKDSLDYLKEFLRLRDSDSMFDSVRAEGGIGIPCVQREDGIYTLDWESSLKGQGSGDL